MLGQGDAADKLIQIETLMETQARRHYYTGEKSRIRETKNVSTDADSRTKTILERLHDLSHSFFRDCVI